MKPVIGCLGAGRMGRGIAVVFAFAGHQVVVVDFNFGVAFRTGRHTLSLKSRRYTARRSLRSDAFGRESIITSEFDTSQ